MSIQDESFPYDDDLEFSQESTKSFVFPHHKPRRNNVPADNKCANEEEQHELTVKTKTNISSSSPLENHGDSTHSSNEFCLSSETSGKTNASEPNDLRESENKKSQLTETNKSKSISYQDIHSEYTKRRYKHVESKVGQYIANMRAQDEKRRNLLKFYRHSSMPETLHERETATAEINKEPKQMGLLRCSTNDLDHHHHHHHQNELQSDQYNYNYDNHTTTTSSASTKDSVSENGIVVDKQAYEQLLTEKDRNDYLETQLRDKNAENWRLKQILDTMRTENSMLKDKLKQQIAQPQSFSGSFGSLSAAAVLSRPTLQKSLLYTHQNHEKSTQTDKTLTPSPSPIPIPLNEIKPGQDMFATPPPSDSNNNNSFDHAAVGVLAPAVRKVPQKNIVTIQPLSLNFSNLVDQDLSNSNVNTTMNILRQRSNSLASRKKSTPMPADLSKASSAIDSVPSSSDSAIDIEVAELSPKTQRQNRREEFIYIENSQQRCAVVDDRNAASNFLGSANSPSEFNKTPSDSGLMSNNNVNRNRRKRRNLRLRMMRFFGACTKCEDPNVSSEIHDSQQSQIPLLEKSEQNYCHNSS